VIERAYLQRIRHARERILITNSYFIPSRRMRYALAKAVRRGVRVRVLLPGQSDVPVAAYAARYLYGYLLRHGIELYEWSQSVLHSKTAVIDGDWCTVGTHNIDRRSSTYNLEINVVVEDREVAARLAARMQQDMEASPRVDAEAWRFRPLSVRLLEVFFYLFRRFL
jgi:cardiolipin synthase